MGSYTPKRGLYKPSIGETGWGDKVNANWDKLDDHTHVRSEITDLLPIKRSDLEYPTEDVDFIYWVMLGKTGIHSTGWSFSLDNFTDKALVTVATPFNENNVICMMRRQNPSGNGYQISINPPGPTTDFRIVKVSPFTVLASEAIDINPNESHFVKFSVSGSTLKGFRDAWDGDITKEATTLRISATDSDYASGQIGCGIATIYIDATGEWRYAYPYIVNIKIKSPASELIKPDAIIEYPIIEYEEYDSVNNKIVKAIKPNMPEDIIEDEVYGKVNTLAVTWGAIDYKGESTMLCAIYGGSPSYLDTNRILKHIEHAKKKRHKVFKTPKTLQEVVALYKQIKKDFKDKLITENELAYQLIGRPELEVEAIADFYERELLNLGRIKRVPTWELHRILTRWEKLAIRHKRDIALSKLRRCRKR